MTAVAADLILPSAMWVEKEGAYGNAERRTQFWRQQVKAPGEARSDLWQLMEFSKRFKIEEVWPEELIAKKPEVRGKTLYDVGQLHFDELHAYIGADPINDPQSQVQVTTVGVMMATTGTFNIVATSSYPYSPACASSASNFSSCTGAGSVGAMSTARLICSISG